MERLMIKSSSAACRIESDISMFCAGVAAFVPDVSVKMVSLIKRRSCLLLLMTILFVFCPLTRGQELAGTFTGTITDTSGAEIPHATISITLNGVSGKPRVVQSNDAGN